MTAAQATRRVALFATCFNDIMWPQTPKAVVRLLRRLGCEVEFPVEQTCCGQMFTNTGYAAEAVPTVRTFVDTFSGYDAIVAPSAARMPGCALRSMCSRPRSTNFPSS